MSENTKEEARLELLREALLDLNDQKVEIPFLSTIFTLAGMAIARWEKSKFEEFLNTIRIPLAFDNLEEVSAHIARNIHHRWMADGLAQGWRLGLETMDDTARKCAYVMVAEYMAREKSPDRFYRQFANLFIECDAEILKRLLRVADAEADFKSGELPSVIGARGAPSRDALPTGYYLTTKAAGAVRLGEEDERQTFLEMTAILLRNSFLSPWAALGSVNAVADNLIAVEYHGIIGLHQRSLWKILRKYLEPVRGLSR